MSTLRQAAQQALEFCEFLWREVLLNDWAEGQREALEKALMQALAEPEQEPVAWMFVDDTGMKFVSVDRPHKDFQPLYTAPTPRKPLTDEQIVTMYAENPSSDAEMIEFARAIERAHGIGGGE